MVCRHVKKAVGIVAPQAPCLPLTREVAFAEQMTEGEKNEISSCFLSLPQSAFRLTAPSSEGAKGGPCPPKLTVNY